MSINVDNIYKYQTNRDPDLLINALHYIGWLKNRIIKIENDSNDEKAKSVNEYRVSVIQAAISVVCSGLGFTEQDVIKKGRKQVFVDARRIIVCACRDAAINKHKPPLEMIGNSLGGRDHATALHSYKTKHRMTMEQMVVYKEATDVIKSLEVISDEQSEL